MEGNTRDLRESTPMMRQRYDYTRMVSGGSVLARLRVFDIVFSLACVDPIARKLMPSTSGVIRANEGLQGLLMEGMRAAHAVGWF